MRYTKRFSSDLSETWSPFGLRTGTFLAKKRIPLRLWYEIIYGFTVGLPAYRLQKILKVRDYRITYGGYKTIRQALVQNSRREFEELKFDGTIEVDESYYGGRFKNLRKDIRRKLRRLGLIKIGSLGIGQRRLNGNLELVSGNCFKNLYTFINRNLLSVQK